MTNQEILEKAIQKAIDGGWKPLKSMQGNRVIVQQWQDEGLVTVGIVNDLKPDDVISWVRELEGIIFNQLFAKALWGEEDGVGLPAWQYHLQSMVIAPDPVKYLEGTL